MTRPTGLLLLLAILLPLVVTMRSAWSQPGSECAESPYAELLPDGEVRLSLEVARTPEQQQRGLMLRESLPADQGMLFVFDKPTSVGFWMVNTLIPLSVAYLGRDGAIQDILDMQPLEAGQTPVVYAPSSPYWFALEVNQGWFASHGVAPGNVLALCYE